MQADKAPGAAVAAPVSVELRQFDQMQSAPDGFIESVRRSGILSAANLNGLVASVPNPATGPLFPDQELRREQSPSSPLTDGTRRSVFLPTPERAQCHGNGDTLTSRRCSTGAVAIKAGPASCTPCSGVGPVRQPTELRLEPTAMPTRVFRLGSSTLGWHPVASPVLARVAA